MLWICMKLQWSKPKPKTKTSYLCLITFLMGQWSLYIDRSLLLFWVLVLWYRYEYPIYYISDVTKASMQVPSPTLGIYFSLYFYTSFSFLFFGVSNINIHKLLEMGLHIEKLILSKKKIDKSMTQKLNVVRQYVYVHDRRTPRRSEENKWMSVSRCEFCELWVIKS